MRELTFKGFLSSYIKQLSKNDTVDLQILAREAITDNPRLKAPLLLYAIENEKIHTLRETISKEERAAEIIHMLVTLSEQNIRNELEEGKLPEEYQKVWNSYMVRKNAPKREEEVKEKMRKKIVALQQQKHCTNYRIYTDLKLNPGNINSWLKNGNSAKVSFKTAEKILDYVAGY